MVLSSKRLIRKTGIQLLTKITVGGFGFSCKSSLFCILPLQHNCTIFFWRIYRVARNFCRFCFVIVLFKRGVWGAFSRFSPFCYSLNSINLQFILTKRVSIRHRRTGRGGEGGCSLGNSDFLGSKRKLGQSQFLKTFPCFLLLLYFEDTNIFYFNQKSA